MAHFHTFSNDSSHQIHKLHLHPAGGQAKWPDVGSSVLRPAAAVALRRADAQVLGGDAGIIELEKVGKVEGKSWTFGRNYHELPIGINNYLSTISPYVMVQQL